MATFDASWQDDFHPLVVKRFGDYLDKSLDIVRMIIGKETTKSQSLSEYGIGGYGLIPEYDGRNLPELNQKRGFKAVYTPKEYAGLARVGYKDAKNDQSGEARKAGEHIADALQMTIKRHFYNLFVNGYNAAFVGADSKPLFSATHPINNETGAETFSNLITDAFSIAAITKAQTMAQRFKTYDGLDFDCDFDVALVSPELEPAAKEYFGKEAKLLPDTAENGANPVYGMRYFVVKGLSAKQWAVADLNKLKRFMKMVVTTEPMVMPTTPDNPLIAEYVGYMDLCFGWSDARMIIGSNPA
jgi:hypothetical protein